MKHVIILCLCIVLLACNDKWDQSLLLGKWTTVEWVVVSSNEKIKQKMDFEFSPDERYIVDYGSEKEKGKYWVWGDYLHTVEDGAIEKKVLILSLTKEKCEIEMNRAGSLERAVLRKVPDE